ncbi:chloramphenicol resistance protein [Clostridium septicum]|uniref:Chloramphenicol resistance protein n=1 Tax=Clostridium septicum TaxID=1504 RepID=A0A9N7PMM2_CLOSE|nr:chloramphenicol resistance protein [Clostridium septicum]AYE35312.1 chloramphenicol resistance protein [Clostridium septicum]UEC20032.1 chloramphenicol resistance protein [Clostridium septicum]USS01912.1 chloramphenicol resistance protein [Clostridium septicum]
MIIDSLRNYIKKCPCLDTFNNAIKVNVNYLEPYADTYSIEEVPIEPIVKKYVNGDSIRQYAFIFTSRKPYGVDVLQNIDNSGFYEKFADWIEDNNNNNYIFPLLDNKLEPLEVKVTSTGYAFAVTEDTAQFQIQLKLKYFKKGK